MTAPPFPELDALGIKVNQPNIGEGGSAVIHRGETTDSAADGLPAPGTAVAVKEYKASILDVPGQIDRIRQEIEIGKTLNHENLVRVYTGVSPDDRAKPHFLVMEWVEGDCLPAWGETLRKNAAWDKIRAVAESLVDGLEALHGQGVLHRDIKPENVMVSKDRTILMDIGVAELTGDNNHTLHTLVKDFVGSVRYASPQFILGEQFDASDDIYSLGATLLELFTGSRPYEDIKRKPVLPIEVTRRPPQVGQLRDNVPPIMKVVLEGCLHPNRKRRPSLAELREALQEGGDSAYVKKEIGLRSTDQRAYAIISTDGTKGGFFADVGTDEPPLFETYKVVRRCDVLKVPSLNAQVQPERWITNVQLRHVHESVGHFKLYDQRWVESSNPMARALALGGRYEHVDRVTEQPQIGDFILKRITEEDWLS